MRRAAFWMRLANARHRLSSQRMMAGGTSLGLPAHLATTPLRRLESRRHAFGNGTLWLALLCVVATARPVGASARWVVLSLPGLRLEDLDDARVPPLHELGRTSALALMSTTTAAGFRGEGGASDLASGYLTLGSGVRTSAGAAAAERAAARAMPASFWADVAQRNPGLVPADLPASRLQRAGLRVGLLAAGEGVDGGAALLAVTAPGVPFARGSAGARWLRRDSSAPYGVVADAAAMAAAARRLLPDVDVLWLAPGDLERAATYARWCLPAAAAAHRRTALVNAGHLLALLEREGSFAACNLLVLSPSLVTTRFGLSPVAWRLPDRTSGLLVSGATHTAGLIANTDVMPHLLASLLPEANRRTPLRVQPSSGALAQLKQSGSVASRADATRGAAMPVFKTWLLATALLVLLPLPGAVRGRAASLRRVGAIIAPFAAILLGAVTARQVWPWPALALGALALAKVKAYQKTELLATVLALLLLADPFLGTVITRDSPLGYSVILGARYYGIGNEWMGYLLGAVLLSHPVGRLPLLITAFVALLHPSWGANLGGALTAATSLAVLQWVRGGPRPRRLAIACALAMGALLIAAVWLDGRRDPAAQTHLGRLVNEVRVHGLAPVGYALLGKLATNARIAGGFWGLLLLCEVAGAVRGRPAPQASAKAASESHGHAVTCTPDRALPLFTAAAALLFNDSGVIAAALMLSLAPMDAVPQRSTHTGDQHAL